MVSKKSFSWAWGRPTHINLPLVEKMKIRRKPAKTFHVKLIFGVSFLIVILSSGRRN